MIVYKIQNLINKKVYIGLTVISLTKRINEHIYGRKGRNSVIHNALIKHGLDSFEIEIIDKADSRRDLRKKEKHWISFYQSCDRDKGYNLTNGGDGCRIRRGYKLTEGHKKKLSDAHFGIVHCHTTPHSKKTKKLISDKKKGRVTDYTKSKMKKVKCLNDNLIHESIEACARFYKVFPQNVLKVCKNLRKSARGYKFIRIAVVIISLFSLLSTTVFAANPIRIKRGTKATIPVGAEGEPLYTTDTKEFFIGDGSANTQFQTAGNYITALTGDVTASGPGSVAATIAADVIFSSMIRADEIYDIDINWGTGANQVSAVDVPIADSGNIITGTEVETALQENRTAIDLNTAKDTNVPTALSVGTVGVNTVAITSDGGADDVTLPAATVSTAGMLTTAKWAEIVANTAKVTNTDDQTIDVFSISGDNVQLSLEDDGEATKTVDISTTTAVTANTAKVTNATHTGEVTGATSLTIADSIAVTNWNLTTPTITTKATCPEIENTGNITIDAINAAANSTVTVTNSDATYKANLSVENQISGALYGSDGSVTDAELLYINTLSSNAQTQINGKAPSLGADDNYVTDAEKVVIGNTSGTNTGDNTVATTGDAAVDFFGAGVTAVTDGTACTNIEGTKLSITTGTLNVTETDSVVGAVSGIVKADGGGNISAAIADTDYLVTLAKDIVTTSPITGGTDNILPGADADVTIAITVLKDLVTTSPLAGGTNDIFPGADSDITISIADAVADGSTKGAATFDANDFDAASGVVSIDNVNFTIEDVLASVAAGDMIYRNNSGVWGIISIGADNEVLTVDGSYPNWETGGAGGGDNISIDSVAVVDPDFVSTGDIDFVDTSNTVTANIQADKITETMLKCVNAAVDEYVLTYESTTGDFEWEEATAGSGDVTSSANITEHSVVRGADGAKGVELSTVFISDAGEMTNTSQPCFLVSPSSTQSNIAINASVTAVFGTEVYDIGNNFASNTFTAPVTGKYLLAYGLHVQQIDADSSIFYIVIQTSNRHYYTYFHMDNFAADVADRTFTYSIVADMDTSDTAYIWLYCTGGAAQTDLSHNYSYFSGALLH